MRDLTAFNADPDTLDRSVANCARVYRVWAERMGKRSRLWDDLSCADLELPVALPPNLAVVLREPDDPEKVVRRSAEFFAERPGGPYGIWSLWPLEGVPPESLDLWHLPIMVPRRRRSPAGRTLRPRDRRGGRRTDRSGSRRPHRRVVRSTVRTRQGPGARCSRRRLPHVGRTRRRPRGFDGYRLHRRRVRRALRRRHTPDARRRGYGEAVTWAATLCRPELPATLQASPMGRPIYERMGYRTIAEFTVWDLAR